MPMMIRKQKKPRAAKHLFVKDNPYKSRVIPNKNKYSRKEKHRASVR